MLFHDKTRTRATKHFLSGALNAIVLSSALYLFTRGFLSSDLSLFLPIALAAGLSMALFAILNQRDGTVADSQPMTQEKWQNGKITKRQFVLFFTAVFGLVLVTPAIVFTVVAPEILPVYWWAAFIVMVALVGFVFATWNWNSNEKKFGPKGPLHNRTCPFFL